MRYARILALATMVSSLGVSPAIQAQPQPDARHGPGHHDGAGQWRLLAFKTVGAGTDRDTIRVRQGQRYNAIQLCAFNAPIHLINFTVQFENGRRQNVNVRSRIAARSCTRAIRLDGSNARRIDRVDLTYERVQRGMRVPLIRVMAR